MHPTQAKRLQHTWESRLHTARYGQARARPQRFLRQAVERRRQLRVEQDLPRVELGFGYEQPAEGVSRGQLDD